MAEQSVSEILDRYQRDSLPLLKRRTRTDYARHIAVLKRALGEKVAARLTLDDLAEFMNVNKGKIQRNRQMAVLSSAFGEAIRWGFLHSNICKEVPRHVPKQKDQQLSGEEFDAVRQIASPRVRWVMDLVYLTGQPQGQIITLRWDQVHADKGEVLFRHQLTGKKVTVRITPEITRVLEECGLNRPRAERGEFVVKTRKGLPYTSEGFRAVWQRVIKKWTRGANDSFTFHDIRAKGLRDNPSLRNDQGTSSQTLAPADGGVRIVPKVFTLPKASPARDAAAVMMPLSPEFDPVYETIRTACSDAGYQCRRASDIWEESTIIQDIFNLIYKAHVVIVDFTTKNRNVFYETGIAHTLGRHVVPIARDMNDVPFDIKHHRVLKYSNDDVGLAQLRHSLAGRLKFIGE